MDKSMSKIDETSSSPPPAKKVYEAPRLSSLGSLRDLTMTKKATGNKDGKSSRFTGRGGRYVLGDRTS